MIGYLLLALGGAVGTILRFSISTWLSGNSPSDRFPWGTFTINLSGSLVIGLIMGIYNFNDVPINVRLFFIIGLLGGYTTFSSFSIESFAMIRSGNIFLALSYVFGSCILGIGFAALGYVFGQSFNRL